MSQIALFNLIDVSKLPDLQQVAEVTVIKKLFSKKIIDKYWDYLVENSISLYDGYLGGIFLDVIFYLKEKKGIDLQESQYKEISCDLTNKRGSSNLILTNTHKNLFSSTEEAIDKLSYEECQQITLHYSGDGSETAGCTLKEAFKILKNVLSKIEDDSKVVIFCIA